MKDEEREVIERLYKHSRRRHHSNVTTFRQHRSTRSHAIVMNVSPALTCNVRSTHGKKNTDCLSLCLCSQSFFKMIFCIVFDECVCESLVWSQLSGGGTHTHTKSTSLTAFDQTFVLWALVTRWLRLPLKKWTACCDDNEPLETTHS